MNDMSCYLSPGATSGTATVYWHGFELEVVIRILAHSIAITIEGDMVPNPRPVYYTLL